MALRKAKGRGGRTAFDGHMEADFESDRLGFVGQAGVTCSVLDTDKAYFLFTANPNVWIVLNPDPVDPILLYDAVVEVGGPAGTFPLLSEALDAGAVTVYVRKGEYSEPDPIAISTDGVFIVGEDRVGTVITFGGVASGAKLGVAPSAFRETLAGTYSLPNNSDAVTGIGTSFTTMLPGDLFRVDDQWIPIFSIADDLNLVLAERYEGSAIAGADVEARNMVIGFTLQNITLKGGDRNALSLENVQNAVIDDVEITAAALAGLDDVFTGDNLDLLELTNMYCHDCPDNTRDLIQLVNATRFVVTGLQTANSQSSGLNIQGSSGAISDCISAGDRRGITISSASSRVGVSNCTATNTELNGFGVSSLAVVRFTNCQARNCGTTGFDMDGFCTIGECISEDNGEHGFLIVNASEVTGCKATGNGQDGFRMANADFSSLRGCIASGNGDDGFRLQSGDHATLNACVAITNGAMGFDLTNTDNSTVNACLATTNVSDGLQVGAPCNDVIVTSCQLDGNTGEDFDDNGTGTIAANNIFTP